MKLCRHEQDLKDEMDYREDVQREIDEADAKRNASGISPEILSLIDAANEGKKAGLWGFGPSLNPYSDEHCQEHKAWENARMIAVTMRLNGQTLRRMP